MSTAQIISELPNLAPSERDEIFRQLCKLQESDLLKGVGPTDEEKRLLDEAIAELDRDGNPGRPWREVFDQLRNV